MRATVADPVNMVTNLFDIVVCVRIKMIARLAKIPGALDHMEHARAHTLCYKSLTAFVTFDTQGITGYLGKKFKLHLSWTVTPNTTIDHHPICTVTTWCAFL